MEIGGVFFPLRHSLRADEFCGRGKVGGNANEGTVAGVLEDVLQQLIVAVGRFDEELGLLFFGGDRFQVFDGFGAVRWFNRKISHELEVLSVHAGSHECQEHGVGADHGDHGSLYLVGGLYDEIAGVCHGGASGFADNADGMALLQEFFSQGSVWSMMLVHEMELQGIDIDGAVEGFEEPAGGPFIFHKEDAQLPYRISDVRRQAEECVCTEDCRNEI